MNEKQMRSMLKILTEQKAPAAKIDLWPAIQSRVQKSQPHPSRGTIMNTHPNSQPSQRPQRWQLKPAFLLASILLISALFLLLPQGRALAQEFIHFFNRGGGVEQILPTPQPVVLVKVTPGSVQATLTPIATSTPQPPFYGTCGDFGSPRCSLSQIRQMVNFPVKSISTETEGLTFEGATGGPENVTLKYQYGSPAALLIVNQGPRNEADIQKWDVAANTDVEAVQIGTNQGEYVKGGWSYSAKDNIQRWSTDTNLQTLRWQEGNILFTISVIGFGDKITLDKQSLVNLAASMNATTEPAVAQPSQKPEIKHVSIPEAEKLAGFQIVQPSWLPDGYENLNAWYMHENKTICVDYQHLADKEIGTKYASLTIAESPLAQAQNINDLFPDRPNLGRFMISETLNIGGVKNGIGDYAYGAPDPSILCGEKTYQDQVLQVQTDKFQWTIFSHRTSATGNRNFLTRQQLVRLVESMTNVHTIDANQLDPDLIPSVAEAEKLAGFHLKLPSRLPEGYSFDFATYSKKDRVTRVTVIYRGSFGHQPHMVGNTFSVTITSNSTDTLDQLYNEHPDIYDKVKVAGNNGIITQGFWDAGNFVKMEMGGDGGMSLIWYDNGLKYAIFGFNLFPKDVWLQIAESMK